VTAAIAPFSAGSAADFALWAQELRETRLTAAATPARVRLFNGNWVERGELMAWLSGSNATVRLNETGSIHLEIPIDLDDRRGTYLAHWALDKDGRKARGEGTNIHVIVEKDGHRIGGRTDPDKGVTLKRSRDGDRVILEFLEDVQELKHVHMAANPILSVSLIQQPKVQFLFAPVDWAGKATLAMNLLRLSVFNFDFSKDIMNPANWGPGMWAQSQIVVMPGSLGDSVAPTTLVTGTIKQPWLDVMAPILEDAEMQIVTRRWLTGDPEPWPGAGTNWRQGTLFVDIVDKSGWRSGTSVMGNLATGFQRTIANFLSNYVEDSYDLLSGAPVDTSGYKLPGFLSTQPARPYVVYLDDDAITGLSEFELTRGAGGPARITVGGQSMPGVNALLEAVIGYAGDVLGDNINILGYGVGSMGGIITAFAMPILKDSILAYMSVPLLARSAEQGWGHYLETSSTGVTQAYTPASIMDLRRRRRETDPRTAYKFAATNALPWLIGDRGQGHWTLGDRVGATTKYLGARVFVCRCRELTLDLESSDWTASFGDLRAQQDALEKAIGLVSSAFTAFGEIGLWS
jgi:hypothetical protein